MKTLYQNFYYIMNNGTLLRRYMNYMPLLKKDKVIVCRRK